ncbi:MAG: hypothetical protein M3R65_02535 [Gemmatimonadota bacterium]|nr:hypothetical protein [Gemmatimonadota bacterium]
MGASVAAVIIAKERRIVERFRDAGATSPERARTALDLGVDENIGFRRLHRSAVIRESKPGLFYLDEEVWAAVRNRRMRVVGVMMVIVILVGIIMAASTLVGR